jgi:hypothetical protein
MVPASWEVTLIVYCTYTVYISSIMPLCPYLFLCQSNDPLLYLQQQCVSSVYTYPAYMPDFP